MSNDPTVEYYDRNAEEYAAATLGADVSAARDAFVRRLPSGARILDAGCGSGRDSRAFLDAGFDVTAIEPSKPLAAIAARLTGLDVLPVRFQELAFENEFDGVWACASLLHVASAEMEDVLRRVGRALKPGGILFASLKIADADFTDKGRRFTAVTPERWREWLSATGKFVVVEEWTSEDMLGREEVKWFNCLAERVA